MNIIKEHPISVFAVSAASSLLLISFTKFQKHTPWYFHQLTNLELGKDLIKRATRPMPHLEAFIKRKTLLLKGINFISNIRIRYILLIGIVAHNVLSPKIHQLS